MDGHILDHPAVLQVLFHPRHDPPKSPLPRYARLVRITVESGISLGGRLYTAAEGAPIILFFHGNGETARDYDGIAPLYLGLGINLLVMDYRGYGVSEGIPTASSLLADALAIFGEVPSLLARYALSSRRLLVMGRSLGSAAAIQVALHAGDAIAGLIIESGFAHTFPLLETLGVRLEGGDEEKDGFGSLRKIAQIRVPTLVIHGEADWLIPVRNGRELHQHSGAACKWLVTVRGAGHNDLLWIGRTSYMEAIARIARGGLAATQNDR